MQTAVQSEIATAEAAAEIARLKDLLDYQRHQSGWDEGLRRAIERTEAKLREARMRHEPSVRETLAFHERMLPGYRANGDQFRIEEHEAGIAECNAALAAMAAADLPRAA